MGRTVGVTTVIPDDPFTCADCCPLKRPPLPPTGGKAQICANRMRESRDEAEHDPAKKAAYTCTKAKPCMFDGAHPQLRFAFCPSLNEVVAAACSGQ